MALGIVTILCNNVVNNLNDATTYTALAAIKGVKATIQGVILKDASPWVNVVPGDPVDEETGLTGSTWWQPITCRIGTTRMGSHDGDWELLGDADETQKGLDTLAKEVRQALCRPLPFQSTGSGYVAQTGVHNTRFAGVKYVGLEENEDEDQAMIVELTIEYFCVDERDA